MFYFVLFINTLKGLNNTMCVHACECVCVSLLTSCERPPADGSSPFSLGRLSLGELQPETGVLLLLGDESVGRQAA